MPDNMQSLAIAEWQSIISGMWDACGKSLSQPGEQERFKQYVRQFSNLPLGLLEAACNRAIREMGKYNTIPTIGAVWEAVRKELHNPHDLDWAIENWGEMRFANLNRLTVARGN